MCLKHFCKNVARCCTKMDEFNILICIRKLHGIFLNLDQKEVPSILLAMLQQWK